MKKLLCCFCLIFFLSCTGETEIISPGQEKSNTNEELAAIRGYQDYFIEDFRCGVFIPPSYDPGHAYPLIIRLHGYSDTTSWNLIYYNEPIVSLDPAIVLTPKCPVTEPAGWGNSWNESISPMLAKTYEMIDLIMSTFNTDDSRIYIFGTSMGGYGTYAAIRHTPDLFAAAYSAAGGGSTNYANLVAAIPFWIFHGEIDNTVPVRYSREMYEAVIQLGGEQIRYTEYEGVAHNVWDYTGQEQTISIWLMAQKKGSTHSSPSVSIDPHYSLEQGGVLLSWTASAVFPATSDDDIWYVEILRDGELLAEINSDNSTYLDPDVEKGMNYEYQITGVNYFFKRGQTENIFIEVPLDED